MPIRLTARARLTAICVTLVAVAGIALIALTYLLVRNRTGNRITVLIGPIPNPPPDALPRMDEVRRETLNQLLIQSAIALIIVLVVTGLVSWLIAGRFLRPIRAISQTAQRVSAADLSKRVPANGPPDELTALATTINGMLDRVQNGVAERDRVLDGHRLFVANAAHELRTPLATMRTAIDVTLDGTPTRAELLHMITDVSSAIDTSQRTLDGLLTLARSQSGTIHRVPIDLSTIATAAVEHARGEATRRQIHLEADLRAAPIQGDETLLLRLITNLLDNALRYNHPDGTIHIATESECLRITNTGPPVDPASLPELFRPFVRGATPRVRTGPGAGLGLSIVDAITIAHNATITPTAPPTGGLTITINFPSR